MFLKSILTTLFFLLICDLFGQVPGASTPRSDTTGGFVVVDKSAVFPGGEKKFYDYVDAHMQYPPVAEKVGIEGRVFVQFVVRSDGSIDGSSVHVVHGIDLVDPRNPVIDDPDCEKEAVRLLRDCPDWIPAVAGGSPAKQRLVLPISFDLKHWHKYQRKHKHKR